MAAAATKPSAVPNTERSIRHSLIMHGQTVVRGTRQSAVEGARLGSGLECARDHRPIWVLLGRGHDPFTWGRTDLIRSGDTRTQYIAALRAADGGDLAPLLEFVNS